MREGERGGGVWGRGEVEVRLLNALSMNCLCHVVGNLERFYLLLLLGKKQQLHTYVYYELIVKNDGMTE